MQSNKRQLYFFRSFTDIIMLIAAFFIGMANSRAHQGRDLNIYELLLLIAMILVWLFSAKSTGLYDEFRTRNFSYEIIAILKSIAVVSISAIVIIFSIREIHLARIFIMLLTLCSIVFISIERYLIRQGLIMLRKRGRNLRSILIIGAGKVGWSFYQTVRTNPHFGYKLVGFLDDKKHHYLNGEYLGPIGDLEKILEEKHVDNVIIALPHSANSKIEEVIRICESYTTRIKIIPDYFNIHAGKYNVSMFGNFPILSFREDRMNELHWYLLKRIFDLSVSLLLLLFVFSWLWPVIGILIRMSSPGPVFFKQERWGRNNKRFTAYKFRTMILQSRDVDESGRYQQAYKDDPRITKIGKILRRTNLDELPQFINVLKGEMSLVGPRPHPTPLNMESKKNVKYYLVRHLVKPGITGWAQANGYRGETRDIKSMQKRIEHDIWYIDNWSLWLDIQIMILTVWRMVKGDPNAY